MSDGSYGPTDRARGSAGSEHGPGEARQPEPAAAANERQVSGLQGSTGGRSERCRERERERRELFRRFSTFGAPRVPRADKRYRTSFTGSRDIIGPADEWGAIPDDQSVWLSDVVSGDGRRLPVYQDDDWSTSNGA